MSKINTLKEILNIDPNNASVWYMLGLEYAEDQEISEALRAYSKALELADDAIRLKISEQLSALASVTIGAEPQEHDDSLVTMGHAAPVAEVSNSDEPETKVPAPSVASGQAMRVIEGGRSGTENDDTVTVLERPITFADVAGLQSVKTAIEMKIIKPFTSPGLFQRFRKKVGGGILLYGPPGCGKTFMARATAGECRAQFINVRISDILDPYIGVSERNVSDLFSSARAQKPSILFFDEVDALGYNRGKMSSNTMRPVIDQLLTELEGIDSDTDRILVIGATNMPWDVDPAFKRPGRFDKMMFVAPPDATAREVIFQLKLRDRPIDADVHYEVLAQATELFSGADIEHVVETATEAVIMNISETGIERPIRMSDLKDAIAQVRPSTIEWLRTVKNYVRYANQGGLYNDVESFLSQYRKLL